MHGQQNIRKILVILHQVACIVLVGFRSFKTLKILYCGYFRSCNYFVILTVVVDVVTIVYCVHRIKKAHQCLSHRTGLSILYVVISNCRN